MLTETIATIDRRLLLIAPLFASVPHTFRRLAHDARRHRRLVGDIQRLRGAVYLSDGYIERDQLSCDGRHQTIEDITSWHLLVTDVRGSVCAGAWYLPHQSTVSIRHLRIRHSPLAFMDGWRAKLHAAIAVELDRARRDGLHYAELGGWAVAAHRRSTTDALLLVLAAYALSRTLGGALGITAANVAHDSAAILRRLGGADVQFRDIPMPAHHDPRYNATVELLRFDSREPSPKYRRLVDVLTVALSEVPVIVGHTTYASVESVSRDWIAYDQGASNPTDSISHAIYPTVS